jgi:hypothetical protein
VIITPNVKRREESSVCLTNQVRVDLLELKLKEEVNMAKNESKAHEQERDLYAAVGKFVVSFEHVCRAMQECVVSVLSKDGLKTESLARAPLVGLTARPLFKSFKAVVTEFRKDDPEDMRILENVFKRIERLIETRNDVIHQTWLIGWGEPKEPSKAKGWKFRLTKHGVESIRREATVEEFNCLSEQAAELSDIVMIVGSCLVVGFSFSKWLFVDKDGTVRTLV